MPKTLCVISGGMDSATLLHLAAKEETQAVSFNYGQRHKKELRYAASQCARLNITHDIIDISSITPHIGGSALTDDIEVPEGHYASANMAITVVPNRNAIMLAIAYGIAVARGIELIGAAMHSGDHAIYPDCRPAFTEAFDRMERLAVDGYGHPDIRLWTPFINKTKTEIASIGGRLGVDYANTWSCYKGEEFHCGICGTCYERKEAFQDSRVTDNTRYES